MEERPFRVLIVDDEPELTEALADVLELKGIEVATADNGAQALERLRSEPFDCVLMDIMMPGMNGVETLRRAREIVPGIIVILMTAYTVDDLMEEAEREGAFSILTKPIDIPSFVTFLDEFRQRSPVLIVDDDIESCTTLHRELTERGVRAVLVQDVVDGMTALAEQQHETVILNLPMDESTLRAVMALRKLDAQVALILMNQCTQLKHEFRHDHNRRTIMTVGKPFDVDHILELLDEIRKEKASTHLIPGRL